MTTVALVATTTATETPEALAARLVGLLESGWDAHLLCKGPGWDVAAMRRPELSGRVELISRPGPLGTPRGGQVRLERRLARLRPDLVHFHSGGAAAKARETCERLGAAVLIGFRADGLDLREPGVSDLWEGGAFSLFQDEAIAERAAGLGCPRERTDLLSPVADEVRAAGPPPDRDGDPPESLRLLSWGPLVWERGLEHSLHAVRIAIDRGVRLSYRILGGGDHLVAIGFERHSLGLDEIVALETLPAESLVEALDRADLFLDPAVSSLTSDAPRRAAMARGVPYIATERPGLDPASGAAVRRRDPSALADAICELAADPARRSRMAAAGIARTGGAPGGLTAGGAYRLALDG